MGVDGRIFLDIWSRKLSHYYSTPGPERALLRISYCVSQVFSLSYLRVIGKDADEVYNTSNCLELDQYP